MSFTRLAIRNAFRHRRRSVITLAAIILGFTAVSIVGGIVSHIFLMLEGQAIHNERLGHLTITKRGYFQSAKLQPEKYFWDSKELARVVEALRADPGVALVTPRMRLFGMASNGVSSTIFLGEAVVAKDDHLVTGVVPGDAVRPALAEERRTSVVVGEELAEMLELEKGASFTLVTQTRAGMANALDVVVEGVENTGNPATNDKLVLMPLALAQELYDVDGSDRLVVVLRDPAELEAARARLSALLAAQGHEVEVKSWQELSLFYEKVVKMFGAIFRVVTLVVAVVVLLTLINTMISAIGERTSEIGTLRAMGLRRRAITRLFATEGALIGALGCVAALPVVALVAAAINQARISFVPPVSSAPVHVAVDLAAGRLVFAFALFTVNALLAAYFASRRAAGMRIIEALGTR
ncbi:ABC transporter permease [Myxococcota bacterium]|nr:ABC transporter permease [Myxococcota bacterium]